MTPVVMTFEQFAAQHDASRQDYGDPGLHRSAVSVSASARKRHITAQQDRDLALQARRDELRLEYDRRIASGEIRAPTRIERLTAIAAGDPTRSDTQAAIRLLAKHNQESN